MNCRDKNLNSAPWPTSCNCFAKLSSLKINFGEFEFLSRSVEVFKRPKLSQMARCSKLWSLWMVANNSKAWKNDSFLPFWTLFVAIFSQTTYFIKFIFHSFVESSCQLMVRICWLGENSGKNNYWIWWFLYGLWKKSHDVGNFKFVQACLTIFWEHRLAWTMTECSCRIMFSPSLFSIYSYLEHDTVSECF